MFRFCITTKNGNFLDAVFVRGIVNVDQLITMPDENFGPFIWFVITANTWRPIVPFNSFHAIPILPNIADRPCYTIVFWALRTSHAVIFPIEKWKVFFNLIVNSHGL